MRKLVLVVCASLQAFVPTFAVAKDFPAIAVAPALAASLPPIELGALIYAALPRNGFRWDALQIRFVRWTSDGIETGSDLSSYRQGLIRVRVNGKASQILKQKWVELAW